MLLSTFSFLQYALPLSRIAQRAVNIVRDINPVINELQFIRMSSRKHEILMAPLECGTMIVIQDQILLKPPEQQKPDDTPQFNDLMI